MRGTCRSGALAALLVTLGAAAPVGSRPITYQFFTTQPGLNFGTIATAEFQYPFVPGDADLSADELLSGQAHFAFEGGETSFNLVTQPEGFDAQELDANGRILFGPEVVNYPGATIGPTGGTIGTNPFGGFDTFGGFWRIVVCGDTDVDEDVDADDSRLLREAIADPAGSSLSQAGDLNCPVTALSFPGCDLIDAVVLRREIEGPDLPPGIGSHCTALSGP